jgi:hypothetical protein
MKLSKRNWVIIAIEAGLFFIFLTVIWLDAFFDLPYILFGMPPSPHRLHEYLFLSGLILFVAIAVLVITIIILERVQRLEECLRVCAWCRKVWMDGKWVSFEEYMLDKNFLRSSHGICEECVYKLEKKREEKHKHLH